MTIDEVAEYLRIPKGSVYKLAQNAKIPCQKVGKHWRFRKEALDRWLEADRKVGESASIRLAASERVGPRRGS